MAETVFDPVHYNLASLLQKIELGEIGLPDIQRPFVWKNAKVRDLFDSMFQGFPVGYLLFWASGGETGYSKIGVDGKQKAPNLLIVDGQQRLTSLYAVLKGVPVVREDYGTERIFIAFRPGDSKFEVCDAAIRKDPEWLPDISVLWSEKADLDEVKDEFLARLRLSREVDAEESKRIRKAITALCNIHTYPFIALELHSQVSEEQVAEVFVRVNSKGETLNQADFILTLMSVFWDDGRKELEQFCRQARHPAASGPSPFNHFIRPAPDQLLRVGVGLAFRRARLEHVYSVLRGKDMETGVFSSEKRDAQFACLKAAQTEVLDLTHWHEFLKCLVRAGYRRGNEISSQTALLYAYTLYLIGRRDFSVPLGDLRDVISRWFFMSSLTGRYANSPETTMAQDLNRLAGLSAAADFVTVLNNIIDDTFTADYWDITLPNELATSAARSPSLFAYHAALNLLDAKVLFSDLKVSELFDPAIQANKAALERHHLFPRKHLESLGIVEVRDQNQIANYALLEWPDNIGISDTPPCSYWPKYTAGYSQADLDQACYWHALPPNWENLPYADFLVQRRKLIARVIKDGFGRL
jgi:hypothetical protein